MKGYEGFVAFYKDYYGDRWGDIHDSLLRKPNQVIRYCFSETNYSYLNMKNCSEFVSGQDSNLKINDKWVGYIMDPASVFIANQLSLKEDDFVCDFCAAPGGKSLILIENLKKGKFWANEISMNRRERLKQVIRNYTPENWGVQISIKGLDATKFGIKYENTFDAILLDAPCSGERHILEKKTELEKWSIKRTKRLAAQQYSLLCSALLALKPGGQLVYSTCALSPLENEEVVRKFLNKKSNSIEIDEALNGEVPWLEKAEVGYYQMPDKCGFGPLYFAKFRKK